MQVQRAPRDREHGISLPNDVFVRRALYISLRGGFWRNFRVKYSESNEMYSRMMLVSEKLASLERTRLNDADEARLAAAITNATGKQVNLKVVIDPSIIGGLVATVGDKVIDGSVRTNLDRVKARLS